MCAAFMYVRCGGGSYTCGGHTYEMKGVSLVCVFCRVCGLYVVCISGVWCAHVIRRCEVWYTCYPGYRGVCY